MDRGTKLMFGAMTIAICLMAFNMVGGKSQEANASMNTGSDYRSGVEPTIVWYGTVQVYHEFYDTYVWEIIRAWSDGTVESRANRMRTGDNCGSYTCSEWRIVSDPNDGLAALSDLNDDAVVDINDLLKIVDDWGPAPPNVIPPSDCPLAMINP